MWCHWRVTVALLVQAVQWVSLHQRLIQRAYLYCFSIAGLADATARAWISAITDHSHQSHGLVYQPDEPVDRLVNLVSLQTFNNFAALQFIAVAIMRRCARCLLLLFGVTSSKTLRVWLFVFAEHCSVHCI